jgi:hypothetical protein
MRKLVFVISLFLIVPALRAQQSESREDTPTATLTPAPQAEAQPVAQTPAAEDQLPPELRPGHSLNPADVDVLTGKRDREREAARRGGAAVMADPYGGYGFYGNYFRTDGRLGAAWDVASLPFARLDNPFFFSRMRSRGFGRGSFPARR